MDHKYQRDKYWPAGVLGTEYNVLFVCENGDAMDYLRNAFKKFALNRHFGILAVRDGPKDSYNYEDIFNHLRPITRRPSYTVQKGERFRYRAYLLDED